MKKLRIRLGFFLILMVLGTASCGLFVSDLPNGKVPHPELHDHFVTIDGVRYHYTEYPASGQDIFMLHGFASSTYTWEKVAPMLQANGYHVWALDMKGFGWSDKPEDADYSPEQLLKEVNGWMDEMGLRKVVFVGNSLGGGIAWEMALMHPDKVKQLVLIDAAGFIHQMPGLVRLAGLPGASHVAGIFFGRWAVQDALKQVYFDPTLIRTEQIDAYYNRMRTENALGALTALARSVSTLPSEEYASRIPEIQVDTLIIWGRDDAWIPQEDGFKFKEALPNARLEVIPFCGHIPQEENPEETAGLIMEFVSKK
ncbi:MAG: alpha/beta hydrolase [Deltaproteobacteria bacterium]|nr:alpha/beta hydrolase [Deltaproteobacteria bacterium]